MPPAQVQGLNVIYVSPLSPDNYFNLLFYTNAESDIKAYEVYRRAQPNGAAGESKLVGVVDMTKPLAGRNRDGAVVSRSSYSHQMFQDKSVAPGTTYCYRVRAVDFAGSRGPFSAEVSGRIGGKGVFLQRGRRSAPQRAVVEPAPLIES